MKITVDLNEADIRQIIADHYNELMADDVEIIVTKETRGYGPGEYEENIVGARIVFETEGEAAACLR